MTDHKAPSFMEQLAAWTNTTAVERELLHHLGRDLASGVPSELEVLRRIDLRTADEEVLGLMPYIHSAYPEDAIPKPYRQTVRELHRTFGARNAALLPAALAFIGQCNASDIPVMLCTGEALRLHYLKDFPRRTHDFDLLTRGFCFKRARRIVETMGFVGDKQPHSVGFRYRTDPAIQIDLHHVLYKHHSVGAARKVEDSLWDRSTEISVQGVRAFLPSLEDVVVHTITAALGDVFANCNRKSMKWMLDIFCLMHRYDVDWGTVRRIADEQDIALHCSMGLRLLDNLIPGVLDRRALEEPVPIPASAVDRIHRYVYWKNRAGLLKMREKWYAHTLHRDSGIAANLASFPRYLLARYALDPFSFIPGDFFQKLRKLRKRTRLRRI